MPTLADLLVTKPRSAPDVSGMIVKFGSGATLTPDLDYVNATGRTPAPGQSGVLVRINGTFYLVGLF